MAALGPMEFLSGPPISARKSKPSTSPLPGRGRWVRRPYSLWAHLCGGTITTITRVRTHFRILCRNLQRETVGQNRTLTNAGLRSDISYVKGKHNLKGGITYQQTFLSENDNLGIVDPTFLASLTDVNGNPCLGANGNPIAAPCTTLAPYDLTRGGTLFRFNGHTDVKELALYIQDAITQGNWLFSLGIRGDIYNGLSTAQAAEPRLGAAYNIKRTNTVLRVSYARIMETPFNENLVLSSIGCLNPVLNPLLGCSATGSTPLSPGGVTNTMPGCNKLLADMWSSLASTSGNTRITRTTSVCWATLPSRFRSSGRSRRSPELRAG